MSSSRLLAASILLGLAVAGWFAWRHHAEILPRAYNPFTELHVADDHTFATRFKLMRAGGDPAYCRRALATSALRTTPLADIPSTMGCGLENGVVVHAGAAALSGSFVATCRLALAYGMFEHHVARPAARMYLGSDLRAVSHLGSHVCRNVAGTSRRSDHATGDALDLAAFTTVAGRRVEVRRDWQGDDRAARFLGQIRDGACSFFRGVLGPDYNAAHADHFHFAATGYSVCR